MVSCSKCQLQNSLDSSFCRKCGAELDADLLQEARSELGRTVAQGFVLFNEGKIDDAAAIAQMALAEDATLATAVSLKGMCHERRGELAEALSSYERVLELTPDSALDRIKVNQLRAAIAAKATVIEDERAAPDKRMALAVAVLAVVFFGSVGALASKLISDSRSKPALTQNEPGNSNVGIGFPDTGGATPNPPSMTPSGAPTTGASNVRPAETTPNNAVEPGGTGAIKPPSGDTNSGGGEQSENLRPLGVTGGTLPPATGQIGVTPVGVNSTPTTTNASRRDDPDPVPDGGGRSSATQAQNPPPQQDPVDDPGQIEINVTNHAPRNSGGSQSVDEASASQNLSKIASQEFQLKRYDSAAKKYERLLRSGGDPARVNQRLAQCYENMGKKSDALSAYQKAAKALKENIQSGKGNVARDKAALESCEAAIKVLNEGA